MRNVTVTYRFGPVIILGGLSDAVYRLAESQHGRLARTESFLDGRMVQFTVLRDPGKRLLAVFDELIPQPFAASDIDLVTIVAVVNAGEMPRLALSPGSGFQAGQFGAVAYAALPHGPDTIRLEIRAKQLGDALSVLSQLAQGPLGSHRAGATDAFERAGLV